VSEYLKNFVLGPGYSISVDNGNSEFIYTDSKTCVEYLEYYEYQAGGLTVRYNADGTIKLNKECMEARNER
jgi:hypothetical protein